MIRYDDTTKKWLKKQLPNQQTTVMQCNYCHLYYKPSLGHKCAKKISRGISWYRTNTKAGDTE